MFIINQNGNTVINSDNVISFRFESHQIYAEIKDFDYDIVLMKDSNEDNILNKWSKFMVALSYNLKIFDFRP